jgi:hypothetical protein
MPGFMVSLAYFDGYRSAWLPANLIQAQRDYFGSHTYERIDEKGTFHTRWGEHPTPAEAHGSSPVSSDTRKAFPMAREE